MTAPPAWLPVWIDGRTRLIERGETLGWPQLAIRAGALAETFRAGVRLAVADGNRVATLIAALAAAESASVPLLLRRNPETVPPDLPAGDSFAVLLQTSGTTGAPKVVRHDFTRLRGRLRGTGDRGARWLLTYEPAAFAGVQVILTALAAGATLIAAPGEGLAGLARAALAHGATHVSGTPSFWRAFLIALGDARPPLKAVTLGGEPADQPLLDRLAEAFPGARLRHIYASTEAGSLFAVTDGRAGFPASWLETGVEAVGLRVRDGILEVRSPRAMLGYAGGGAADRDGWIVTGDLVAVVGDRVLFTGRADGRVNVGGVKVSPEAVEALLLTAPGVQDALVAAAANPITGRILTASVVPMPGVGEAAVRASVRDAVAALEPAARPRLVHVVERLELGASGKKRRGGNG
ncbi:MAG TPA: fatty acid--CoA ligase family protein [Azospirillum sp.]|nr:fatty acid--CoA ligase family protein [Azospirillum sp.]